jgi:hypothetical protein
MKSGIAGSRSYFVQVYELVERVSQLPNVRKNKKAILLQKNKYGITFPKACDRPRPNLKEDSYYCCKTHRHSTLDPHISIFRLL